MYFSDEYKSLKKKRSKLKISKNKTKLGKTKSSTNDEIERSSNKTINSESGKYFYYFFFCKNF